MLFTIKNLALYAVAGLLPIAAWGFYVIPNWDFLLFNSEHSYQEKMNYWENFPGLIK